MIHLFLFLGFLILYWILKSLQVVGDTKKNKEYLALRERVRSRHRIESIDLNDIGPLWKKDYAGQLKYCHDKYIEIAKLFRQLHPIGSVYEYENKTGMHQFVIRNEKDYEVAFRLEYRTDITGDKDKDWAMEYCLQSSRVDAIKRGYAPDNVWGYVTPHWKPDDSLSFLNSRHGSHTKYDSYYLFSPKSGIYHDFTTASLTEESENFEYDEFKYKQRIKLLEEKSDEINKILEYNISHGELKYTSRFNLHIGRFKTKIHLVGPFIFGCLVALLTIMSVIVWILDHFKTPALLVLIAMGAVCAYVAFSISTY